MKQEHQALQQSYVGLEKFYAELTAKVENQQQKIAELEKVKNESEYAREHWQKQCLEYQKILEAKTKELANTFAEIKILSQNLADMKQAQNNLLDQNKLLGHEK